MIRGTAQQHARHRLAQPRRVTAPAPLGQQRHGHPGVIELAKRFRRSQAHRPRLSRRQQREQRLPLRAETRVAKQRDAGQSPCPVAALA